MTFNDLHLIAPVLRALEEEGYSAPTAIQEQSIPYTLAGQDILGIAQTGTGKTAAFAIPIIQNIHLHRKLMPKGIKALILTPTRELAIQIDDSFKAYGRYAGVRHAVIFGGVKQYQQVKQLRQNPDVLIATPGRLLDLVSQKILNISNIKILVLDEADRMLDMGFITDVRKIINMVTAKRQTLFFSATMPAEVTRLSSSILRDPQRIEVAPPATTVEKIDQHVYLVEKKDKRQLLVHLLKENNIPNALVFTRTKYGADRVCRDLRRARINADSIHGNKNQNARQNALRNFKNGRTTVLVATDIAARGIDVDDLSTVINYELPNIPETYVHRIGRTGRAGAVGAALSFCDLEERAFLRDIHRLIKRDIPVVEEHPYASPVKFTIKAQSPNIMQKKPSSHRGFRRGRGGWSQRKR